jgi:hypothetical protein
MLVIFTGKDTKQILNQGKASFKSSQIDHVINIILAWNIFVMMFCIGIPLACLTSNWVKNNQNLSYLKLDYSSSTV